MGPLLLLLKDRHVLLQIQNPLPETLDPQTLEPQTQISDFRFQVLQIQNPLPETREPQTLDPQTLILKASRSKIRCARF